LENLTWGKNPLKGSTMLRCLESHDSSVELVGIKGKKIVLHCVGYCAECESDCIGVASKERMPEIQVVLQ